jgi:ABC-type Na+ efflux pump permease subunit
VNKSLVMIKREFLARVKTKGFIIGTVVAPVLMVCLMVLPGLFMHAGPEAERKIAVVDLTGRLAVPLQNEAAENKKNEQGKSLYTVIPVETGGAADRYTQEAPEPPRPERRNRPVPGFA